MTVELIAAFAAGIVSIITAIGVIISSKNSKKLDEVHVLVNSRLTIALEEISQLKKSLHIKDNNKKIGAH